MPRAVVDRLHALGRPLPAVRDAEVRIHHILRDQARVVDLEHEARVDDGPVLLAERVGELLLVFLLGAVELVREGREDVRRRDCRHEHCFVGQPLQRVSEIVDVGPNRRVPLVADRPRADVDAMPAIAAATARPLRDALGPGVVVGERPVLAARVPGVAFTTRRRGLAREAVEALDDVAEEARLALLTVGDDVDARRGLPADGVSDRVPDELGVGLAVVRLASVPRFEDGDEGVGPGEAADVRRQDSVRAPLHRRPPRSVRSPATRTSAGDPSAGASRSPPGR